MVPRARRRRVDPRRGDGESIRAAAARWKNTFRFSPVEEDAAWPVDLGATVEYGRGLRGGDADAIQVGGLLYKEIGPTTHALNLLFAHELGNNAAGGVTFGYAAQSRWVLSPALAVGLEAFGEPGRIGRFPSLTEQGHRAGPVLSGAFEIEGFGTIGYELGYLFGLTSGTPDGTLKWLLAYQVSF